MAVAGAEADQILVGPVAVVVRTEMAARTGVAIPLHHPQGLPLRQMAVAMEDPVATTRVQAVPTLAAEAGD